MPDTSHSALLSLRAAMILTLGLIIGTAAGLLTYAAHRSLAEAVLAGGGAAGSSVVVLHGLIDRS